ncbi:MAG: hypothetical protein BMS9Abin02_0978 [Anaerolineae bacterium]|nr:MAG: hypothetical protein BMS9Abin02_0978 [Anaerolineae bacterium]
MIYPGIFAIVVGLSMFGQWAVSLIRKQVPEFETEPYRIWFHLAGESSTAALLIAAGIGLLAGQTWGTNTYLIALGMLAYTVIVSPGYFAQKGQWSMVALFGLILILGMTSLIILF